MALRTGKPNNKTRKINYRADIKSEEDNEETEPENNTPNHTNK